MNRSISFFIMMLLLTITNHVKAQIITNPSFESNSGGCPTDPNQMSKCDYWAKPTYGTSDYFNCSFKWSLISAHDGTGYVGSFAEDKGDASSPAPQDYKEYVTNTLSAPLVAGVTYTISFYVSEVFGKNSHPAFNIYNFVDLPTAERGYLGLCFSTTAPTIADTTDGDNNNGSIVNSFAPTGRVYIPADHAAYTSRNTWVQVTLQYTATGGEQYMTVGQFRPGATSLPTVASPNIRASYFLFDDFSASICPAGSTAPALSAPTTTGTSVDLSTMLTGTPPAGAVVEWHTSATQSAATLMTNTTVTATSTPVNYWVSYYSSAATCYSPAAKVTVVSNACPSETVDLTALPHSAVPSGAELVWYKDGPYDGGGTLVADPETVGNGIYWPYFYDELNDCHSPIGSPVVVAIKSCITYCTKPGTAGTALASSVGILTKGTEPSVTGWPETVPNGYLVLDAETKGMVVTHMTTDEINALTPVEGMLVYDTEEQCVKLYRGTSPGVQTTKTGWVCIERICNE